ncbi:MAG: iron-sulfur cluster repair di-iron protein [Proteobacteria bacterium]|nr:MAG: iron-sulfur cluster repair di-iron protein [Pseudomonadota bacterium]
MNSINSDRTVGELVLEHPSNSRIFEEYGIDYCCGGKKSLWEACAKNGISVDEVLHKLNEADTARPQEDATDYASMRLDDLVEHIVSTHHAYLIRELPRLRGISTKVAKVHGDKDDRLGELEGVIRSLAEELGAHMMKEERVLFPLICLLAQTDPPQEMHFGTLGNPIGAMEADHEIAGNTLDNMRRLTDNYTPPDWACNTYRALLDGLHELEVDLHQHIHKENNILFPRALDLEAALPR